MADLTMRADVRFEVVERAAPGAGGALLGLVAGRAVARGAAGAAPPGLASTRAAAADAAAALAAARGATARVANATPMTLLTEARRGIERDLSSTRPLRDFGGVAAFSTFAR